MDVIRETNIEYVIGEKTATMSTHERKYINKLRQYEKVRPGEAKIVHTNPDGSIVAHFPVSWVKISPPRKINLTEERKQELSERLKRARSMSANHK